MSTRAAVTEAQVGRLLGFLLDVARPDGLGMRRRDHRGAWACARIERLRRAHKRRARVELVAAAFAREAENAGRERRAGRCPMSKRPRGP